MTTPLFEDTFTGDGAVGAAWTASGITRVADAAMVTTFGVDTSLVKAAAFDGRGKVVTVDLTAVESTDSATIEVRSSAAATDRLRMTIEGGAVTVRLGDQSLYAETYSASQVQGVQVTERSGQVTWAVTTQTGARSLVSLPTPAWWASVVIALLGRAAAPPVEFDGGATGTPTGDVFDGGAPGTTTFDPSALDGGGA